MPADKTTRLAIYRTMVTIRQFETMAGEYFAAGQIPGFIHLSIGQEGSSAGVCSCLRPEDYVATTHRGHGHMIAKGADRSAWWPSFSERRPATARARAAPCTSPICSIGILGANGVVAGGLPLICGAGLSTKLRKTDQVAVAFFGDGAAGQRPGARGHEHGLDLESFRFFSWCENNQWASTTPRSSGCALGELCQRARGLQHARFLG